MAELVKRVRELEASTFQTSSQTLVPNAVPVMGHPSHEVFSEMLRQQKASFDGITQRKEKFQLHLMGPQAHATSKLVGGIQTVPESVQTSSVSVTDGMGYRDLNRAPDLSNSKSRITERATMCLTGAI